MTFDWKQVLFIVVLLLGGTGIAIRMSSTPPVTVTPPPGGSTEYPTLRLVFVNREKPAQKIENVKVTLASGGPSQSLPTDDLGQVAFQVFAESKNISVSYEKYGFKSGTVLVDLKAQANQSQPIPLTPDPESVKKKVN
jgi:hypothetical protein